MRSTSQKFSVGLLVLFVLGLVVFLVMFLSKKKATVTVTTGPAANPEPPSLPRPQRNNNPFALIQLQPSQWLGLVGTDPGQPAGFLKFDTALNGTRAGFINLWNRYFSKGLRNINQIAAVYLGTDQPIAFGAGGVVVNKAAADYATALSKITGFDINRYLTWNQAFTLGRAIEKIENGYQWVSEADFQKGYELATAYTGANPDS